MKTTAIRILVPMVMAVLTVSAGRATQTTTSPQLTVKYIISEVCTVPGCDVTYAICCNSAKVVAGYAYKFVPPGHGNSMLSHPFVWQNGKVTALPGIGGKFGQAYSVNSAGDVAGYAETSNYEEKPIIWRRANGYAPERLTGGAGGVKSLSEHGNIAGGSLGRNGRTCAAIWNNCKAKIVGATTDEESVCNAINSAGVGVGFVVPAGKQAESMRTEGDRSAAMWVNGREQLLRGLGGPFSECKAINDQGQIVGWAVDGAHNRKACSWNVANHAVTTLAEIADANTEAHSINGNGDIVGQATVPIKSDHTSKLIACLWHNGTLIDLNTVVPPGSGWTLSIATHISDSGVITGFGTVSKFAGNRWRAFMLVPVIVPVQ